ncbi:GNAT family N-acetyltransferase [Halioglobus sp. HI00S01]|uniref:GNAT family N-acetyltransferase n=1 Tax=Halioglobus sp. HI00S01 TaxID=1822214 RepID=UPI0018D2825C
MPTWLLKFKLRHGKPGFYAIYDDAQWIGLMYANDYRDIVFIQFLAIAEHCRSSGYGGQVLSHLAELHPGKRLALNIEVLDESAENYSQRVRRKAFYTRNGFAASGFLVKEPAEKLEMLVRGGAICEEEIEAMYRHLFGRIVGLFVRPQVMRV